MSGSKDTRDDATYLADVARFGRILFSLLERKKPEKIVPPARSGKVITIASSLVESKPQEPRSRLSLISRGGGRDIRLLEELPDHEIIAIAKKGGRILRSGDVAKVRSAAGESGEAADVISAMDSHGLFDS